MLVILKDEVSSKNPRTLKHEIKMNLGIYKCQRVVLNLLYLVIVSIWSLGKKKAKVDRGGCRTKLEFIGLYFSIFRRKMPWSLFCYSRSGQPALNRHLPPSQLRFCKVSITQLPKSS